MEENTVKEDLKSPSQSDKNLPDIWEVARSRGNTIDTYPVVEYDLSSNNAHFFEIEDLRKRSVKCTSCKVRHGFILEAHRLHEYKLENGILYLKGKALNRTPQ